MYVLPTSLQLEVRIHIVYSGSHGLQTAGSGTGGVGCQCVQNWCQHACELKPAIQHIHALTVSISLIFIDNLGHKYYVRSLVKVGSRVDL